MKKVTLQKKIILSSITIGLFAGFLDAFVDSLFFDEGSFLMLAFTDIPPKEIYIRFGLFILIVSFGVIMSFTAKRIKLAEKRSKTSEERLNLALEGAQLGLWDWNIQTGEMYYNKQWVEMLGYEPDELEKSHASWKRLVHPDDMPEVKKILDEHLEGRTSYYETEHRLLTKDGSWKWILDTGKVFEWDEEGKPLRAAGTHRDITDNKLLEEKLRMYASTDILTGVANRREGLSFLDKEVHRADRNRSTLCICFLDIDGFKAINDLYGHQEGDFVLKTVSDLMHGTLRKSDMLVRFGGDEFLIILPESSLKHAQEVWSRIESALQKFNNENGKPYAIALSQGISMYSPDEKRSINDLISEADHRMYEKKNI